MYHSLVCRILGDPTCMPDALPWGEKPRVDVDTLEREVKLLGVDNKIPEHWPIIEDLLQQADRYYDEVIAHSNLFQKGYRITFEADTHHCKVPYFGANTASRTIMLFNVSQHNQEDWPAIKNLLLQADITYSFEWKH